MYKKSSGFTLLELLIALTIVIVLCAVGIPSYQNFIAKSRTDAVMNQLYRAIQLTRSEAIKRNSLATLCATSDDRHCSNDWSKGYLITIDDQVIKVFHPLKGQGKLSWKGFPNKPFLQMTQEGFTNHQNGTFFYQLKDKNIRDARKLIVSKTGRIRFS